MQEKSINYSERQKSLTRHYICNQVPKFFYMRNLLLLLFLLPVFAGAQSKKQKRALEAQQRADEQTISNLKTHLHYLLPGKGADNVVEDSCLQYISKQFKSAGLLPRGTNGYLQEFTLPAGRVIDGSTQFSVNGNSLLLQKEFFPLAFSANKEAAGSAAIALRESGQPWFVDVKDWLEINKNKPEFNIEDALRKEGKKAASRGADALIVVNSSTAADGIRFNNADTSTQLQIPVVYITGEGYKKHFKDRSASVDLKMNIGVSDGKTIHHNIIGYIDNGAPQTVVISANRPENIQASDSSAFNTSSASGTAALLELAAIVSKSKSRNNFLFILFSNSEPGYSGSNYWLNNPAMQTPVNYIINVDDISHYNPESKLCISGHKTSPEWNSLFTTLVDQSVSVKFDTISDAGQFPFYQKNIPFLLFSTRSGTNVSDGINLEGELKIIKYIDRLIRSVDGKGKLTFIRSEEPTQAAR